MTKLEIATYLGFVNVMMSQAEDGDKQINTINENVRQACCEAQLILFELARREFEESHK